MAASPPPSHDPSALKLGVDLGTTRVVVAVAHKGNFPIVTFETPEGEGCEWFPTLVVRDGDALHFGFDALEAMHRPGAQLLRSLKRRLQTAGPQDSALGLPIWRLAEAFLAALRRALLESSNLPGLLGRRVEDIAAQPFEVCVGVPANANANQRLITADAFRQAGFSVLRLIDEPSAAGLEYAWRRPADASIRKRHVAVYDLGGGTFDASVIAMSDSLHEVLTTEGIARLGGDDFDAALLELACERSDRAYPAEGPERDALLEICRHEKERIQPTTRRLLPELFDDADPVRIPVADYEARVRPLVRESLDALERAIGEVSARSGHDLEKHTVVYQVGGASQLPAVGRVLRERFGRRVWRSPYPHASVAIGLGIAAEGEHDRRSRILGRFTRHFGVWREREAGRAAAFDAIFAKDTLLASETDGPSELTCIRRYRAAHNVGHYRWVECSRVDADGTPAGDVTPWQDVRFPLVPELLERSLDGITVERLPAPGDEVEERYRCDADGIIHVDIVNLSAGYSRSFDLHG